MSTYPNEKKEYIRQAKKSPFAEPLHKESSTNKPYSGKYWGSITEREERVKAVFNHKPGEYDLEYGNCTYSFSSKLKHVSAAIKEAEYILNYTDDWDENGALATDLPTFEKIVDFIHKYSNHILNQLDAVINSPFIDIMPDGGISVTWDTERGTMAIIFKKDSSPKAYYFIEDKTTYIASNSWILIGDKPYKTLAAWMEEFLAMPFNQCPK